MSYYFLKQENNDFILQEINDKIALDGIDYTVTNKSLKYVVFSTPTAIGKSLKYTVLTTPASIDKSLQYAVSVTQTPVDKDLAYAVVTIPAATEKDLEYKVQASISIEKDLKYTIPTTPAATEKDLEYAVFVTPAAIEKNLAYEVLTIPAAIEKDLQYVVTSTVAAIEKDLAYSIAASPAPQKSLKYTVFSTVAAIEKSLSYSVPTSLIETKTLLYKINATHSAKTKSLKYEVKTIPTASGKSLKYCVITHPAQTEFNSLVPVYSPKAYYRFSSGTPTTDDSGNSHTLSTIVSPIDGVPKFGASLGLGVTDAYTVTNHTDFRPSGNFSISAWIKTNSTGTAKHIFQSFSANTNIAGFYFRKSAANKLYFVTGKNTGTLLGTDWQQITGSTSVNDGAWHFVTATYDGSYLRLYLDGVSDATAVAWTYAPAFAATNYVNIGCSNTTGAPGSYWNGALDDIAFWNGKALSTGEITSLYAAELNTIPALLGDASLKAYYRFEEGYLTTDTTVNAHTLTAIRYPITLTSKFNGFTYFQTTSGYAATDHSDFKPSGNFTIGAWIKTTTTTAFQSIFNSFSANTNYAGISLYIATNNAMVLRSAKNTGITINVDYKTALGGTVITDGKWHFIAGTWDGTNLKLYLDGNTDGSSAAWTYAPAYAATNYVRIGCVSNTGTDSSYFGGAIDDLFFLNGTALTLAEIKNIYTAHTIGLKYGVVVAPTAKTKSLRYTALTPTAPTKLLKYTVWTTKTALTKNLKYTVFTAPTAVGKSLKYTVPATVAATEKDLKYQIKTIPSAAEKSLTYTVVAAHSAIGKSLKYTVFTTKSAIDKSLVYSIAASPGAIGKSLRYCIVYTPGWSNHYLLQENGDFILQENGGKIILDRMIDSSIDLTYCVWNHLNTKTKSLKYTVFTTKTPIGKSLRYAVVTIVSGNTKSLEYTVVHAYPAIHKSLKYTVTIVPSGISKTLIYKVVQPIPAITKSLKYVVTTVLPAITKSLTYSIVLTPAKKHIRMDYRIWLNGETVELYHNQNVTYAYNYRTEEYIFVSKSLTYCIV